MGRGLILLMAACLLLGGCGKSSSTTRSDPASHPQSARDSGGGSGQFLLEGGDNSIQEFGEEARTPEREVAAAVLHGFLDARAAGDWAAACGYASSGLVRSLRQSVAGVEASVGASCAVLLEGLTAGVPRRDLREAASADVGSLRVEAGRGYLIYRGAPGGTVYAFPMLEEGGSWKVAALAGTVL